MARLGIDFGTTNTVAVMHDRGLFSVVLHEASTRAGAIVQEIFPSAILIEEATGQRWYGLEADRRFGQVGPGHGHIFVPSLKRQLRDYAAGKNPSPEMGDGNDKHDVRTLLIGFLRALADSIRHSQDLEDAEPLETVVTWPANANGAQRHITRACFREAGFDVLDTLNEPTASAIELADCLTAGRTGNKQKREPSGVAVFDLGGGTFDASVVWVEGSDFRVLSSGGMETLGGDDFDAILLDMFLEKLNAAKEEIGALTRYALLRQARSQKEMISSGTIKSLSLNPGDFGLNGRPVAISTGAYFERIAPLIRPAVETLGRMIESATAKEPRVAADESLTIYLVGGSSKLPLVAEMVAEEYPQCRLILTDKPFRSVAMGAAICAAERISFRDVFARHFGVIRLRDHGQSETFDTIFPTGTPLPRKGEAPLERVAWYHPQHNIGHLRYLECSGIGPDGLPDGSRRPWTDILFPYDPALPLHGQVSHDDIVATDHFAGSPVCEVYRCDSDGVITVELCRPACQDARTYEIFHD